MLNLTLATLQVAATANTKAHTITVDESMLKGAHWFTVYDNGQRTELPFKTLGEALNFAASLATEILDGNRI